MSKFLHADDNDDEDVAAADEERRRRKSNTSGFLSPKTAEPKSGFKEQ